MPTDVKIGGIEWASEAARESGDREGRGSTSASSHLPRESTQTKGGVVGLPFNPEGMVFWGTPCPLLSLILKTPTKEEDRGVRGGWSDPPPPWVGVGIIL